MSSLIVKRMTVHPFESTDGIPKNEESEQHHSNNTLLSFPEVGLATPPISVLLPLLDRVGNLFSVVSLVSALSWFVCRPLMSKLCCLLIYLSFNDLLLDILRIRFVALVEKFEKTNPWHMGNSFHNLVPFLRVSKALGKHVTCHEVAFTRA